MKMKKITAAALAAALVVTSTGLSGLAAGRLTLTPQESSVQLGGKAKVTANVTPESASDAAESDADAIKWVVEGPATPKEAENTVKTFEVTADVDAYLSNNKQGDITVTATLVGDESSSDAAKITIETPVITAADFTIKVGETGTIKPEMNVDGSVKVDYSFTSKDTCVKVSGDGTTGTVEGLAKGTATVTVTATYNKTELAKKDVTVTVNEVPPVFAWVKGENTELALKVDEKATLEFEGATGTVKAVVNPSNIATAEVSGSTLTVTAKEAGTATITLTNGGTTLTATVTVTEDTEIKGLAPEFSDELGDDATQEEKAFAASVKSLMAPNTETGTLFSEAAGEIAKELKLNLSKYDELKDCDSVEVYIDTMLKRVDMADGVVKSVTYDITPYARGFKGGEARKPVNLSDKGFELTEEVRIPIPVPGVKKPLAYVKHEGENDYFEIIKESYVNWHTTHFSKVTAMPVDAKLTLVDPDGIYTHEDKDGRWYGTEMEINQPLKVYYTGSGNLKLTVSEQDKAYIDCTLESDDDGRTYILITAKKLTPDYAKLVLTDVDTEDEIVFRVKVNPASDRPYTPPTVTGSGSGSGSGSSYTKATEASGEWVVGEKGWWFRFKDGSYPSNGWMQLEWQGKTDWYYFNAEGYMVSGWITDVDGHRYFLHDKMDGTQGYMYTGWHQIDGKWYYFSTVSGGPLGSLLTNTTTPDGYAVGADGVWIQ